MANVWHINLHAKVAESRVLGKTVDIFGLCRNSYKESERKFLRGQEIKEKVLYENFLNENHIGFIEDIVYLIDKQPFYSHVKE